MGKLRVFFTIALVVLLLPLSAFGRHKKGDVVQDPNHSNITRECVSDEVEESDRWLVHITGTLPVSGMHNGHPYVDLGLKVKWAACDLNATKPEQNGARYGWAEVVSKKNCTRENSVSYGKKIYRSTILGNPQYDAARKHWGGKWRMPTGEDFYMLIRKCKWEEAEMNGKKGFLLTSIKNGNVMFVPSCRDNEILGYYWTTDECDMEDKELSVELMYTTGYGGVKLDSDYRNCQHAIRPVLEQ
ncbi:MAG TPA: hypothetical protein DCP86_03125 [Porphyromonadaceae bacterium]|nr:hypothetical protein [Porphyromonadaceae bacterium]